jgi:hypothetical protein
MQRMYTYGLRYMNVNEQVNEVEISFCRFRGNALHPEVSRAVVTCRIKMAAHCVRTQWNVRVVHSVVPCHSDAHWKYADYCSGNPGYVIRYEEGATRY